MPLLDLRSACFHGITAVAELKVVSLLRRHREHARFPRHHSRGRIEGPPWPAARRRPASFPRHHSRGRIEGVLSAAPGSSMFVSVSTASQPWPN